jgi:hypothetical protein
MARTPGSKNKSTVTDICERLARVEEQLKHVNSGIDDVKEMAPRVRSLEVSRSYFKGSVYVIGGLLSFIAYKFRTLLSL